VRRALLAVALAACTEQHQVSLDLGEAIPLGFQCVDDSGDPLALRAVDGAVARINIVVDYIRLGGVPSCLPFGIVAWCRDPEHACEPILAARSCQALDPIPLSTSIIETAMRYRELIASLEGTLITAGAPQEPVLVRLVATVQPCAELVTTPAFDQADLVGCLLSCPVQLAGVDEVFLGTPTLDSSCTEDLVIACASTFNF
jgi:hypothetical protein